MCSTSPVMVTSPYEWKILKWDEKPQTNKQTHNNHKRHQLKWVKNSMRPPLGFVNLFPLLPPSRRMQKCQMNWMKWLPCNNFRVTLLKIALKEAWGMRHVYRKPDKRLRKFKIAIPIQNWHRGKTIPTKNSLALKGVSVRNICLRQRFIWHIVI